MNKECNYKEILEKDLKMFDKPYTQVVQDLLLKMMAKDPKDRPSASEVMQHLALKYVRNLERKKQQNLVVEAVSGEKSNTHSNTEENLTVPTKDNSVLKSCCSNCSKKSKSSRNNLKMKHEIEKMTQIMQEELGDAFTKNKEQYDNLTKGVKKSNWKKNTFSEEEIKAKEKVDFKNRRGNFFEPIKRIFKTKKESEGEQSKVKVVNGKVVTGC